MNFCGVLWEETRSRLEEKLFLEEIAMNACAMDIQDSRFETLWK